MKKKNYLERLVKYDEYLGGEIEHHKKQENNNSNFISGMVYGRLTEKYEESRRFLYDAFPELKEYVEKQKQEKK